MNSTASLAWAAHREEGRSSIGSAQPDLTMLEIIEASGIRLGLQLAKSIIANQFFDDLCPLLFGFGIAHGGTGNFTNSHAKPRC